MAEFTILQRNPDIVFLQLHELMNHIQVFTRTIFANISAAIFINSSFTGQIFEESERTDSSRLNRRNNINSQGIKKHLLAAINKVDITLILS